MLYFAYGSNCNPAVMQRKQVRFRSRQSARLSGFRLAFSKKSLKPDVPREVGFANIHEDDEATVEGVLYEIVAEDLELLDASERYPEHYTRISIVVETLSGEIACAAYQAQADKIAWGLRPSREYLGHLLAAREWLSKDYYENLARTEIYRPPGL